MAQMALTNFTGGEISPILSGRTDLEIYANSCARMENFIPTVHGPVTRRGGFRYIAKCKNAGDPDMGNSYQKVRLIPYAYSADNSYILEMGHQYFRVLTEKGLVLNGPDPFLITTPYTEDEIFEISFAQSGINLYLSHKNHEPMIISCKDGQWACETLKYTASTPVPSIASAELVQLGQSGQTPPSVRKIKYAVSNIDANGRITDMSAPSKELNVPAKFDYENYVHISISDFVYGNEFMLYQIMNDTPAYIGRSKVSYFNEMGLWEPNYTKLPPAQIQKFTETDNHPSKVAFFDGRLVFAASNNEPNTIWGSMAGDYSYFAAQSVPTDSCAWKFTLDSGQINKIMWLLPSSMLLIGTIGAEWRVSGGNGGGITANSVEARRESSWGSSELRALSAGQEIIFVDRSGKNIRTFRYANESAGYNSVNLTTYAEHLTRNTSIKDWDYATVPYSIIWSVTENGNLLGMTFDANQKVAAWHRHSTEGSFESVAVMSNKGKDILFAVIKRNINGQDLRYIEIMEDTFTGDDTTKADEAFFVDSGLTYKGEPTPFISGLDHLKGKTVCICTDGAVHPKRKVSDSGTVTLDYPASTVNIGLQYNSILQTMPIEAMLTDGSSTGRCKRISDITVRLENTIGLLVGTSMDNLIRVPFRDENVPMSSAPKLFNGDKKVTLKGGYEYVSSLVVMQDQPMPMTLIALFPRIKYGEK